MKLSIKDLTLSGLFIIVASTTVSNLYRPKWGIIYAVVNLIVITLFLYIRTLGLSIKSSGTIYPSK